MKDNKIAYWQKLQDPRWQKLRLEVFQRDQFKCVHCTDSATTLHVHHEYYIGGREPWEYPLSAFTTLCAGCHKRASEESSNQTPAWEVYNELYLRCVNGFGVGKSNGADLIDAVLLCEKDTKIDAPATMELLTDVVNLTTRGFKILDRLRVMVDEADKLIAEGRYE